MKKEHATTLLTIILLIMAYAAGYSIGKRNANVLKTIDRLLDKRIQVHPDNHDLMPVTPEQFQEIQALMLVRGLVVKEK